MAYDNLYPISRGRDSPAIRPEVVDYMVKQTAQQAYKFKQAVSVVPTSSWNNTFFREDQTVLAGQSGNSQKGVPRGANFPQAYARWQEVTVRVIKHALEANIPWEDVIANGIPIQARQTIKLTEGIVKSVDDDLWDSLTESRTHTGAIQSYAVGGDAHWDGQSAAIIDDLMSASELIGKNANVTTDNLICFINPRQKRLIMKYLSENGNQFPSIATGVVTNGNIGQVAGIQLVESNSVTGSFALVVKPKSCATYKEFVSLRSNVTEDPFKSVRIRVVEEGVCGIDEPKQICLIFGTELSP